MKPVALSIVELCLVEGISQLVGHAIAKKSYHLKFKDFKSNNNLVVGFRSNLKSLAANCKLLQNTVCGVFSQYFINFMIAFSVAKESLKA